MTGYGSGTAKVPGGHVSVEVKSVNQRFLDVNMKGPREYVALERLLVKEVRGRVRRGKVDIFVNKTLDATDPNAVTVDATLALTYQSALQSLAESLGRAEEAPSLEFIAAQRGVLVVGAFTPDVEADREGVLAAATQAIDALVEMRTHEGEKLRTDLMSNVEALRALTDELEKCVPALVEAYRESLRERLERLLGDTTLEEGRLEQEVALLADRSDIHEEIIRLRSHLDQLTAAIESGGEVGRKLDFILQEVHREINTSGSKASDPEAGKVVVEMKAVAERMREQAQNVE